MFKFVVVILAFIACAAAKPGLIGAPLAYSAPLVAAAPAGVVTATSSQVIARNHNGFAAAPIFSAAPVAAPFAAAYTAPATYAAPLNYAAYSAAPFAAKYVSPFGYAAPIAASAPFGYSAPLRYAAAATPYLF